MLFHLYTAEKDPEDTSPGKKRKTTDTREVQEVNNSDDDDDDFDNLEELESFDEEDEDILDNIPEEKAISPPAPAMKISRPSSGRKPASRSGGNGGGGDLSTMLEGLNVSASTTPVARKPIAVSCVPSAANFTTQNAFMCYTWKDKRTNQFLTFEVLVLGTGEQCSIQLEEEFPGGPQLLSVTQALPPSWFRMSHFEDSNDMNQYNVIQRYGARKNFIRKAVSGQSSSDDKFLTKQIFRLPFRCDDVNIKTRYDDTWSREETWQILGKVNKKRKKNTRKEEKRTVLGHVNILTIQLVSEEKAHEKKKEKTPKKKVIKAVLADDSSSHSGESNDSDSEGEDEEEQQ